MQNNKDIAPIEIDLSINNSGTIDEIFLQMFGVAVKNLLGMIFGQQTALPVKIRGNKSEIASFARTLARDKKYVKAAAKYGLNDPRVLKDKYKLRKAAANFKRATGIDYPLGK